MRELLRKMMDQYLPAPEWREVVGVNAPAGEVEPLLADPLLLGRWFGGRWGIESDGRMMGLVWGPFLRVMPVVATAAEPGRLQVMQQNPGWLLRAADITVRVEADGAVLCRVTILAQFTFWPAPLRRILGAIVSAWLNPKTHRLKDLAESRHLAQGLS